MFVIMRNSKTKLRKCFLKQALHIFKDSLHLQGLDPLVISLLNTELVGEHCKNGKVGHEEDKPNVKQCLSGAARFKLIFINVLFLFFGVNPRPALGWFSHYPSQARLRP